MEREGRTSYLLFFSVIKPRESQVLQNKAAEGNHPVITREPLTAVRGGGYGKGRKATGVSSSSPSDSGSASRRSGFS